MTRSQTIIVGGLLVTLALLAGLGGLFYALDSGLISPDLEKPKLQLQFHTSGNQDKEVRTFFAGFAAAEGLRFKDTTPQPPPELGPRPFTLELKKGEQDSIAVRSITQPDRFFVFVYERKPDPALEPLTARLTAQLQKQWPDTAPYDGP